MENTSEVLSGKIQIVSDSVTHPPSDLIPVLQTEKITSRKTNLFKWEDINKLKQRLDKALLKHCSTQLHINSFKWISKEIRKLSEEKSRMGGFKLKLIYAHPKSYECLPSRFQVLLQHFIILGISEKLIYNQNILLTNNIYKKSNTNKISLQNNIFIKLHR